MESIQLGAAKTIIGCSSKTCNEVGGIGVSVVVNNLDDERYAKLLVDNEWDV